MWNVVRNALCCGAAAGLTSTAAVMALACLEGRRPWQPLNGTSHWLWGEEAGAVTRLDARHTGIGLATNQGAAMFWGAIFGGWLAARPPRSRIALFRDASLLTMIAGLVDYGLVPKRLTPGWELAVSRKSVAATFAAMGLGLAVGGLVASRGREGRQRA